MNYIDTVLVANRGEIACRIIRTLQEQGIRTVAVYSDADRDAPHVHLADTAVHIGPSPARESYLVAEKIIDAAARTGAQAIHPGYGFLSENAAFAGACADAGIIFMGPPASAIETMGDKISAREAVEKRGVPTVPGISRPGLSDADLIDAAPGIGFPVLIKPSAGGGGKGMHRVDDANSLPDALRTARREASSAFGDDTLFLEHFVDTPRHIEVQVLADSHGTVIHAGERECSLQRRHQKVIEEAPSVLLDEATRDRIGQAACDAARSVGYVGAGTVEFIVPANEPDTFYFMEMNTRLQVEHPVTEEITGLDLVAIQLDIARGLKLPLSQEEMTFTGHSIEARIYAEDPAAGFLPTGGVVQHVVEPSGSGVRVDSGITDGSEISSLYDPMLMKVIVHGADRAEALARLDAALAGTVVAGVGVNTDFCRYLINVPEVVAGALDTGLLDRVAGDFVAAHIPDEALIAATMHDLNSRWPAGGADSASPWQTPDGWRPSGPVATTLRWEGDVTVEVTGTPEAAAVVIDGGEPHSASVNSDRAVIDGVSRRWSVSVTGEYWVVTADSGQAWSLRRCARIRAAADAEAGDGQLRSPMPGSVIAVSVEDGAHVEEGDAVLVVEAMKMEHTLRAPHAGEVTFSVTAGDQVGSGQLLAEVTAENNE